MHQRFARSTALPRCRRQSGFAVAADPWGLNHRTAHAKDAGKRRREKERSIVQPQQHCETNIPQALPLPPPEAIATLGGRKRRSRKQQPGWQGFLVGPEHSLLVEAVYQVLGDSLDGSLVFVGPSGSGKTHLAAGLAWAFAQRHVGAKSLYLPAQQFAKRWAEAAQIHRLRTFWEKMSRLDCLAIDDLQELRSREVQHAVAQLLDICCEHAVTTVLTIGPRIEQLARFADRLSSRLRAGLVVQIPLPSERTRFRIVTEISRRHELNLPCEITLQLAKRDQYPGEILKAMKLVKKETQLPNTVASSTQPCSAQVSVARVAQAVAFVLGVRLAEIRGTTRSKSVSQARQLVCWLAGTVFGHSLREIGRYLGNRDHSTIGYCRRQAQIKLKDDPAFYSAAVRALERLGIADPGASTLLSRAVEKPSNDCQ